METKERLKNAYNYLRDHGKVHKQQDVANAMGISKVSVSRAFSGNDKYLTKSFLKRFNSAFNDIFNEEWLTNNKGDMLNVTDDNTDIGMPVKSYISGVPYYNVDFIGGFDLILNDQTVNPEYYIQFKPYDKATCWCNITGHSMEPEISHGDIIALREILDASFLPYGEIYAIVTTNEMRTVKRIGPSSNPDNYTLIPTNKSPEYGIQELPKNMILHIFEVMGCMKRF